MKCGKDLFVVISVVLGLFIIWGFAAMNNAQKLLIDRLEEIELVAGQQGGWVYFPALDKDLK